MEKKKLEGDFCVGFSHLRASSGFVKKSVVRVVKEHIVFLTEHLSFGGAEMVLSEYLQNFDIERHNVSLVIRDDLGEKNYILKTVPAQIPVHYLFNQEESKYFDTPSKKKFFSKVKSAI